MVIYYWKLQTPDALIFNMIREVNWLLEVPDARKSNFKMIRKSNLLLETPHPRKTNFQYDQRGSRCWWYQWFSTLVRGRPCYVLFTFHVWHYSSLFHIAKTDICIAIIASWNSAIFFLIQCLNSMLESSSHLAWKRQLFSVKCKKSIIMKK